MQPDFRFSDGEVLKERTMSHPVLDPDLRLDENQIGIMQTMIEREGMDEREAKMRVLNIAKPPDHFQYVPPRTGKFVGYPRMIYLADGKKKVVNNPAEYDAHREKGWVDRPLQIHVDLAAQPDKKRMLALERDLKAQLKAAHAQREAAGVEDEQPEPVAKLARGRK
jgi:hypothetical protein